MLLLALGLFGGAVGVADAHSGHAQAWGAGEVAIAALEDLGAVTPEREESRPSAEEVGKRRVREFFGPATPVKVALAQTLKATPWSGVADASIVDQFSTPLATALSAHACAHVSSRLQLKLQLGQAP
ncbi:hypothetical protein [Steroidobacter cummioxidans]|uniref:hypothetical protein n=1 Tax=Steroidobacter cummioxidans TaxID=1803913 RepID=UPI00128FF2C4|nr:hypothetical protein [Steroidobacter cummioxidans]